MAGGGGRRPWKDDSDYLGNVGDEGPELVQAVVELLAPLPLRLEVLALLPLPAAVFAGAPLRLAVDVVVRVTQLHIAPLRPRIRPPHARAVQLLMLLRHCRRRLAALCRVLP